MKTMNKTLTWLVAAALSFALVTSADAQSGKQRTGKVVRIKGDARYSNGNKVWQPLKVGTILKSGNIVQTAPNSFADIVVNEEATAAAVALQPMSAPASAAAAGAGGAGSVVPTPDQDVIRVLDDSYLVFDSLTAVATGADTVTETLLDLKKGSIFGSVKKQAAASRFEIKTPNGVAGIRGTWFLITALGNFACGGGSMVCAFTDAAGNLGTQVIGGGQQFNAVTGETAAIGGALMGSMHSMAGEINDAASQSRGKGKGKGKGKGHGDHDHGHHDHISKHRR